MAARNVTETPPDVEPRSEAERDDTLEAGDEQAARYRPLPTGSHGLDPELVKRDQRERLENALIELIAQKGYAAVRIVDLARLAHVSQPTFYRLYADKEALFLSAYDEVADRCARTVMNAYRAGARDERLTVAMRAWAELAAAEPEASSLLVLGAFGAGAKALERRRQSLAELERSIQASRDGQAPRTEPTDLTVKAILGGIREVTATRLRESRPRELPLLADELAAWAGSYPRRLPAGLDVPPPGRKRRGGRNQDAQLRARTARRGAASERPQRPAAPVHRQKPARAHRRRHRGDCRREGSRGTDDPRDRTPSQRLAADVLRHLQLKARRVSGRAEGRHAPGAGDRRPGLRGRAARLATRTARGAQGADRLPRLGAGPRTSEPRRHVRGVSGGDRDPQLDDAGLRDLPRPRLRARERRARSARDRRRGRRRRHLAGASTTTPTTIASPSCPPRRRS